MQQHMKHITDNCFGQVAYVIWMGSDRAIGFRS